MSGGALVARPLAPTDREAWAQLAARHGSVFDFLAWTDPLGTAVRRIGIYEASGSLRGGFVVGQERRFGLRVHRNPPYTPRIGPFYEPIASNPSARADEQRAVVTAMADYLTSSRAAVASLVLSTNVTDPLPFRWQGWKVVPQVTYRLDLGQSEDVLLSSMSGGRRKNVRKAASDGITVEGASDTSALRPLVMETYARQGMRCPLAGTDVLLANFPPGANSYCFIAWMGRRPVAGVYVAHDAHTAYYLLGGYSEGAHHGAGALAMWHAILRAKELGLSVFDLEGSVVPPIERYFRGFGGTLTLVLGVHRAWLPLEVALKVRYRCRF